MCQPIWDRNKRVMPFSHTFNEALPLTSDEDLFAGGIVYEASLHEALMDVKKVLATNDKYSEYAERLVAPASCPMWLFFRVPVTFAGAVKRDDVHTNELRTTDLKGGVSFFPVGVFDVNTGLDAYEASVE